MRKITALTSAAVLAVALGATFAVTSATTPRYWTCTVNGHPSLCVLHVTGPHPVRGRPGYTTR